MRWLAPLIGISAGVLGIGAAALWFLRPRHALVLYSVDSRDTSADQGEFRNNARLAAAYLRTEAIPISSAEDIVRAVRSAPSNLGTTVMIGHATSTKFFSPTQFGIRSRHVGGTSLPSWISPDDFARVLVPKLARGAVTSLAGCSAARSPREPSDWTIATGWHGGAESLAGRIRDALTRAGQSSGEVRGHVVEGSTLRNPQGRTFYIGQRDIGRPGTHIMALAGQPRPTTFEEYRDWNNYAQGAVAVGWMLGRPIRLAG